jgi:hypothetical protein
VKGLGGRLEDLSRQARKGQRETSAKLADAAGTIRDKKLPERILQGNPLLESGYNELLKGREEFIRGNLEELARQVEAARGSLGSSREAKLEDAVNRSRALAEGLESLGERLRSAQTGQPGARGRPSGKGTEAGRSQQAPGRQGERGGGQPPGRGEPGAQAGSEQGQPGAQGSGGAEPGASAQAGAASRGQGEPGRQQTQGGAGGRPSGDIRGLSGNSFGPPVGAGGVADEDYRQLRREIQERLGDAQGLGRVLDRDPTRTRNLEQVIEALRRLDGARNYSDPEEVARLRAAITAMRQVELDLSRELAATSQREKYYSSDDNGAPAGYRRLVEEYYKALARTRSRRP